MGFFKKKLKLTNEEILKEKQIKNNIKYLKLFTDKLNDFAIMIGGFSMEINENLKLEKNQEENIKIWINKIEIQWNLILKMKKQYSYLFLKDEKLHEDFFQITKEYQNMKIKEKLKEGIQNNQVIPYKISEKLTEIMKNINDTTTNLDELKKIYIRNNKL